jgi:Mitosis protein DIM1
VVVIRFGRDQDPTCMVQDEVLMSIADKVKNFAVIYLVRTNKLSIVGVFSSSCCEGHCTHTCSFALFVSSSTGLRHFYTT